MSPRTQSPTKSGTRRGGVGGRPPKFREPRRPVTVTLPERTLNVLSSVDADRARAIVKLADRVERSNGDHKAVEMVPIGGDAAVLVIGLSKSLKKISWLRQIEIAPARHLLSIEPGKPIDSLEVALADLLDHDNEMHDRGIVEELLAHVRRQRRDQSISKEEILVIRSAPAKRGRSRSSDRKAIG